MRPRSLVEDDAARAKRRQIPGVMKSEHGAAGTNSWLGRHHFELADIAAKRELATADSVEGFITPNGSPRRRDGDDQLVAPLLRTPERWLRRLRF